MLDNKNKALFGGFVRLSNFPLDKTSVFEKRADLERYLANDRTAYAGQSVFVKEEGVVYVVHEEKHGEEHALSIKYIATATEISAINQNIAEINNSIDDINTNVVKIENQIQTMPTRDELTSALTELKSEILGEEDSTEEIDSLNEVIAELSKLSERVKAAEADIEGIKGPDEDPLTIDNIKEISDWITTHKEDLEALLVVIDLLKSNIEERLQVVEQKVIESQTQINEKIEAITANISATYATKEELDNTIKGVAGLSKDEYEIFRKPRGSVVDYRDKEIRVLCYKNTIWDLSNVGLGGANNTYYLGFKAYAPDGAVYFKDSLNPEIVDDRWHGFVEDSFGGVDEYERKFSIRYLPVAENKNGNTWVYIGEKSTSSEYAGWYYSVEWYDKDKILISKDLVRINCANENCYSDIGDSYVNQELTKYVKHTEIKDKLAEIDVRLSDVEHTLVVPFSWSRFNRANAILPMGSKIKNVEIEFTQKVKSVSNMGGEKPLVSLQEVRPNSSDIVYETTLVYNADVGVENADEWPDDLPVMCYEEEIPAVFNFSGVNYTVKHTDGCLVRVETENLENSEGNVYIRYLRPM